MAVFEPRSNTMKLGTMQSRLAKSLEGADLVYCYASHLGWDPEKALAPLSSRAAIYSELDPMVEALGLVLRPGRPRARDVQRRLRRHPREAPRAACREPELR